MIRALVRSNVAPREVRDLAEIRRAIAAKEPLWVDLYDATDEEIRILGEDFKFHPLAIEDCVLDVHHPKVDDYKDYLYLVVHTAHAKDNDELATHELDIFLGRGFLLTYHSEEMYSVEDTWRRCAEGGPAFGKGFDFVLFEVLDRMADRYVKAIEDLDERVEEMEDRIFGRFQKGNLQEIYRVKRALSRVRRVAAPQREVMLRLARAEFAQISPGAQPFYRDVYDHFARLVEMADSLRDLTTGAMEAFLSLQSNRMNEIMKVLTIVSLFLLPMGVVVGWFGMNFEHMDEFRWPHGPLLPLGLMVASSGLLYGLLKWRKWF